ncbi:MAG TPA: recombination mediator RecR [Bacteroidales bacterium]|nr:recombination mediator RecR [Bacteroidales bacterium]
MNYTHFSSKLLEAAVEEFARLPGIGQKTALRLVLHLLRQDKEVANNFGKTIIQLRNEIMHCKICQNISDTEICNICSDNTRDRTLICVVENVKDVIAVENTHQYKGLYHVLGGIISPMDGIGPNDLSIKELEERLQEHMVKELILALSTTMEGDTTSFYLYRKFKDQDIMISSIARGVSIGDELEYTDEITLGRSIVNRTPFKPSLA